MLTTSTLSDSNMSNRLSSLVVVIGVAVGVCTPTWAQSAARMAAERGCYNCHGDPPRRGVRSFEQIAGSYARVKDKPAAESQALDRMHHGSLFTHVATHERLSDEDAATLVHWLFQGGL